MFIIKYFSIKKIYNILHAAKKKITIFTRIDRTAEILNNLLEVLILNLIIN